MNSGNKTATIYLLIYALIFNAVSSPMAFGGAGSMGKESVLFCTSAGYQWLSIDAQPESEDSIKQHCKLCLFPPIDDSLDSIIHSPQASAQFAIRKYISLSRLATPKRAQLIYLLAQGRAPPLEKPVI